MFVKNGGKEALIKQLDKELETITEEIKKLEEEKENVRKAEKKSEIEKKLANIQELNKKIDDINIKISQIKEIKDDEIKRLEELHKRFQKQKQLWKPEL